MKTPCKIASGYAEKRTGQTATGAVITRNIFKDTYPELTGRIVRNKAENRINISGCKYYRQDKQA